MKREEAFMSNNLTVTWAIIQPGQQIPVELIPILNVLFPRCEGWIAGSDFF